MAKKTTTILNWTVACVGFISLCSPVWALNLDRLEPSEIETLQSLLTTLEPSLTQKQQDGTAILLRWDELYAPLNPEQKAFLDEFRHLRGKTLGSTSRYYGELEAAPDLAAVGQQTSIVNGVPAPINPQYLPKPALAAYQRMMDAMDADIGKRLFVESGYRSPAYQAYLFLFFMSNHDYSLKETNRFVALPGHSEHGNPARQAIDFMNQEGINGDGKPEAFEALPEYQWLTTHASAFGFALSYPRGNSDNTAFEPWHWRYEGS